MTRPAPRHPAVERLGRVLFAIEAKVMTLSAVLLAALMVLINVEVLGRYFFNYSTLIADEYGAYLYAWIVLLGGVHLLRSDRYLTMTALVNRLSPSGANAVAILGGIVGLLVCALCLWSAVRLVSVSWSFGSRSGQPSGTMIAYPQMAMLFGYGLLCVAYGEELLRRALGLRPRRAEDDEATYGVGEIG